MMEKLITMQFEEDEHRVLQLLARMQSDVNEYAARSNANPKAVAIRQEIIDRLQVAVLGMGSRFSALADLKTEHEQMAFQRGYEKATKDLELKRFKEVDLDSILNRKGIPHNELIRAARLAETQRQWPELY